MRLPSPALTAGLALAGAAALVVARPAAAQAVYDDTPTVGEVVVQGGPIGPDGRPDRLSQTVSYADLDLSTWSGRDTLRHRIRDTARSLCEALNEPGAGAGDPIVPSCVDQAIRGANAQMHVAVDEAYDNAYARQADASAVVADDPYAPR